MKMNEEEKKLNAEGHKLHAQGAKLIRQAELSRRKRELESGEYLQKQREIEELRNKRNSCFRDSKKLQEDIVKSAFAYPSIVIESASHNTANNWDTGEILIRFSRKS